MYTIYADDTKRVSINCPKCGLEQNIYISKFKDNQKKLKGKCRCGEPYQYTIEFRKRYRECVRLIGEYIIQGIGEKGEIVIWDLSMSGIWFECMNPHHISKNDVLRVNFKLDNSKRSDIRKSVTVIWVRDNIIGAQFIKTKLYEEELQSYLQVLE
jgi:hypothetical protein